MFAHIGMRNYFPPRIIDYNNDKNLLNH